MKQITTLIIILASVINCYSQTTVSIPDSIVTKIVDELVIKDHLSFVVNLQDSTLKVYQHSDSLQRKEIETFKVKVGNDELIIKDLNVTIKLQDTEIAQLKEEAKKERWHNIISFLKGLGVGLSATILYILFHSVK